MQVEQHIASIRSKQAQQSELLLMLAKSTAIEKLVPHAFQSGTVEASWLSRPVQWSERNKRLPVQHPQQELATYTIKLGNGEIHAFDVDDVPEVLHIDISKTERRR